MQHFVFPLPPTKAYLLIYNVLQFCGWTAVLFQMVNAGLYGKNLYQSVNPALKIFQTLAVLEILHAVLGLVKSSPLITGFQVFSRVFVLWAVLEYSEKARQSVGFPLLLICWTLAEMTRYAFYATTLVNLQLPVLIWLRYSMFIILYPFGITGELLCMWKSLDKIADERPLAFGYTVNWLWYAYGVLMLTYLPVFPKLYMHMLHQRKKALVPLPSIKPEGKKAE